MKKIILTLISSVALLSSCYKNEITYFTDSTKGNVVIRVEEPTLPVGVAAPTSYTVEINGEKINISGKENTPLPNDLEHGEYTVYVYSNSQGISASNGIVSIESKNSVAIHNPEAFFFGTQKIIIEADKVITSDIQLKQFTREVVFDISVTSDASINPEDIKISLDGLAGSWDCVNDKVVGARVRIEPPLSTTKSLSFNLYNNSVIIGSPTENAINLNIKYASGTMQYSKDIDVTDLFANAPKDNTPITILGAIEVTTSGTPSFSATIKDWSVEEKPNQDLTY